MSMNASSVQSRLSHQPHEFEFAQVVRLLNAFKSTSNANIHFSPEVMPEGAPAEVQDVQLQPNEVNVTVGLEALSGSKGLIPDYLYAELLQSLHQDENALQGFVDVFNQRYLELKAHIETSRHTLVKQEYDEAIGQSLSRLSQQTALACMFALPGANSKKVDSSMIRHGLALSNKGRSLSGLQRLLSDYFSLAVKTVVSSLSVHRIQSRYQTRLGSVEGQNQQLGRGFWLGSLGNQAYKALEVHITPETRNEYLGLLSNQQFAHSMKSLVQAYLRESLDIKIYMFVKREYIDEPQLSGSKRGFILGEANCLAAKRRKTEFRKILIQQEKA